ncbi:hypothetical protein AMTRI_Chr02g264460 [Amborella trichopoda]
MASIEKGVEIEGRRPLWCLDVGLRLLSFSATLTAVIVMATGKETITVVSPLLPFPITQEAKFNQSPSFIYFVVANAVACAYSIFTAVVSGVSKKSPSDKLLFHLPFFDAVFAGIVGSATGASAAIAYVGLKGNSHAMWPAICPVFGKFCRYVGGSTAVSLVASIAFVLLVGLSSHSLYRRRSSK